MRNDTTFQGDGKVAYVPVVVNTKLTKPSNADRIRSMTDEELGEFLGDVKRLFVWCGGPMKCVGRKSCRSCVMEWLAEPPKELI